MSKPDFDPVSSCYTKRRYTTLEFAERMRKQLERMKAVTGLWTYPCSQCGGYHVGHRPKGATEPQP